MLDRDGGLGVLRMCESTKRTQASLAWQMYVYDILYVGIYASVLRIRIRTYSRTIYVYVCMESERRSRIVCRYKRIINASRTM